MKQTQFPGKEGMPPGVEPPRDWRGVFALSVSGFALAVLAGLQLLAWNLNSRLETDLRKAHAPEAWIGERLHDGISSLMLAHFQYHLSGGETGQDEFQRKAREISGWITAAKPLPSEEERRLLKEFRAAFNNFLSAAAEAEPVRAIRRDTAERVATELNEQLSPVMAPVKELVRQQQERREESLKALLRRFETTRRIHQFSFVLAAFVAGGGWAGLRRFRLNKREAEDPREKLASLGILAAGVAHEIRNPLTAIKFRLFSLKKALGAPLAENEDYQTIRNEIDRLETIVKGFLLFARPAEPNPEIIIAREILEHLRDLLQPEMTRRGIHVVVEGAETADFLADRQQIEQVLINLAQNAADAMEAGGTVTLRARTGAAALGESGQEVVLIEVSDTGPGIPKDIQKRLFDPFFSTKEGGTGLGLAIAARIVEKNGGTIQFASRQNHGTTFTVLLPRETKTSENTNSVNRG